MTKKFLMFFIVLTVFTASNTAFADVMNYTVGPRLYKLNFNEYLSVVNAEVKKGNLEFGENSTVYYQTSIPFESSSLYVAYTAATDASVDIYINDEIYNLKMSRGSNAQGISFKSAQRKGDKYIIIKSDKPIAINEISFLKIIERVTYQSGTQLVPDITDFEKKLENTKIVDVSSPLIQVNGAKRYINYNDTTKTPYIKDSTVYLPIDTLARALGYYYETSECCCYFLIRNDNCEFIYKDEKLYMQKGSGEYEKIDNCFTVYNEQIYLPVRFFASLAGYQVAYKDGFIIMDDAQTVKDIMNSSYFDEIKKDFANCKVSDYKGTTYYVAQSKNAGDSNIGTIDAPFRTLKKAADIAKAGDRVIIREGVYKEILAPKNNGTPSNPIIFEGYEKENVTISATDNVGEYEKKDGDMLVYSVATPLAQGRNQIYLNGEALCEGRYPNSHTALEDPTDDHGLGALWPTRGEFEVNYTNAKTVTSKTSLNQEEKDYWKGATLVSSHFFAWVLGTGKVINSKKGELTLGETSTKWWFQNEGPQKTNFAYLTNHIHCVDLPKEWYMDTGKNKLYIIPPKENNVETLQLEYKARQITVDLSENECIQLKNINTFGGGMKLNDSKMCVINGGEHKYISHYTYSNDQREGFLDSADIYNPNGAPQRGELGIYLGGENNAVINTKISWSAASGIYATGVYGYITNNVISDCGYMGSDVTALFLETEAWKTTNTKRGSFGIYNNTVYNSGRSAYGLSSNEKWYWTHGLPTYLASEIAYNEFYDGCLLTEDTGEYYLYGSVVGSDKVKEKMHNNYVYATNKSDGGHVGMIYYDNYTQMAEVYDNIIFTTFGETRNTLYTQLERIYGTSFATVSSWNNINLGSRTEGKKSFKISDFPRQKPYFAGSTLCNKKFTMNYDMFNKSDKGYFDYKNITVADGAKIEDAKISLEKNNSKLQLDNCKFDDGENALLITFNGDKYNTGDVLTVSNYDVNDKLLYSNDVTLTATGPYNDSYNSAVVKLLKPQETSYVKLFTKDWKSSKITGIGKTYSNETLMSGLFYSKDVTKTSGGAALRSDGYGKDIVGVFYGSTVLYENVTLWDDVSHLDITASTMLPGNILEIYIDEVAGDPIGKITVEDTTHWSIFKTFKADLTKTVKSGKHNIYIVVKGPSGGYLTSNLFSVGLY